MAKLQWTEEICFNELKKDGIELSTKYTYSHQIKTKDKNKQLSLGRILFNTVLPENFELINKSVNKPELNKIIDKIITKYEPKEAAWHVRNIQRIANKLATLEPRSFNIDMFTPSQSWEDEKKEFQKNVKNMSRSDFNLKRQKLIDKLEKEMAEQDIPFVEALNAKSGGKMNTTIWSSLQIAKGVTPDIEGNVNMISKGISDGYNIEEYYQAAAEARNGFFIKTQAVRDPGYLARKVTMSNANIKLDNNNCKSKKYFEVVANKKRAKTLIGRYMLSDNKLVLIEDVDQIIDQKIKIRSPLYCKSKTGICPICYGKLAEKLNTDNIGILAGGAINNSAVNNMMMARHNAEKTTIVDVNFIDIIKNSTLKSDSLNLILEVHEKEIFAKDDIIIEIDKHEYDERTLNEYGDHYTIPGLLNVRVGNELPTYYFLPFNFEVNLMKCTDISISGRHIILNYKKGELILAKDQYSKVINPAIITKILDGITKYVKEPDILINMLIVELSNIDSVHLELIISNMFRDKTDNKKPARLGSYKNSVIIGCKQLPFIDSWLSALAFENINKSIKLGLVNNDDAKFNDIEKVLMCESYRT